MILYFITFAILTFLIVTSKRNGDETVFKRNTTDAIRGFAMLLIIVHHVHNNIGMNSVLIKQFGYLATAVFFFISGYGNNASVNKCFNNRWIVDKFIKIFIPFIVFYSLYILELLAFYKDSVPTIKEIAIDVCTLSLPNQVSWFPKIIVLCFFVTYISRLATKNIVLQSITIIGVICCYIYATNKLGLQPYWFNSVLCYGVGYAIKVLEKIVHKVDKRLLILTSIITLISVVILSKYSLYIYKVQIIYAILICVLCYLYSAFFDAETIYISWIGTNSFEMYLSHIVCLQLFDVFLNNVSAYFMLVLSVSILFVVLYKKSKSENLNNLKRK